jgi:DNA transposition AAA+ family ATPase
MMSENTLPVNGIAETANLGLCDVALERAIDRTGSLPGMVCLYGPSGFGKSIAATHVACRRRAYYIQAKSVWSRRHTLAAILHEMGVQPGKATIPEMLDMVAQELALSGRPLIVDEMDHLVERNVVELIRDIYESSQAPILLIGEEMLPTKLKRWERFHGRVLSWVPAQPVTLDDAIKLVPLYAPSVEIAEDLLQHLVDISGGSVRRVAVNLELINDTAGASGADRIDRQTWGRRELYTGEAPKRRLA